MRVGLLLGASLSSFHSEVFKQIKESKHEIVIALIDSKKPQSLLTKLKKNIRRGRGGYVLIMAFKRIFVRSNGISSESQCLNNKVPSKKITDLYSDKVKEEITDCGVEALVLLGGFGIIKEPILSICKHGVISYHHGDMRKYRGMPPVFWELYNNEKEVGVTLQRLSAGLDCGSIILERKFPIEKNDTLGSAKKRVFSGSEDMMLKALNSIEEGGLTLTTIDKNELGDVYTLPNLKKWIYFHYLLVTRKF